MKPPLIDFQLITDEETRLFLTHEVQKPYWFFLTDGHYWMNLGNDQLYRYSDAIVEKYKLDPPFVYYELQRLWEDILEKLPNMLDPIPDYIFEKIQPGQTAEQWRYNVIDYSIALNEDFDDYLLNWMGTRCYYHSHIPDSPEFHVWRNGEIITIHWDNTFWKKKAKRPLSKVKGTIQISVKEFIEEIRSFDRRFMAAMRHKIDFAREYQLYTQSELENVEKAYEENSQELERVLRERKPDHQYNWRDVEKMLNLIPIKRREPGLSKEEIAALPPADIQHKALLVCVNKTAPFMRLNDATNFSWKVSKARAEQADVVLACEHGQIIGAFVPERWMEATEENFPNRFAEPGRYGFVGHEAPEDIQRLYVGKRVPDEFAFGSRNPVRYTWK